MKLKKEAFIVIFIVMFVIGIDLITNYFLEKWSCEIEDKIKSVNVNIEAVNDLYKNNNLKEGNKYALNKEIKVLKNKWFEYEEKLSFFIEHDELEKVSKSLIALEENCKNEVYTDALEDGVEFLYWLNHFKEKDMLKLKNIF